MIEQRQVKAIFVYIVFTMINIQCYLTMTGYTAGKATLPVSFLPAFSVEVDLGSKFFSLGLDTILYVLLHS